MQRMDYSKVNYDDLIKATEKTMNKFDMKAFIKKFNPDFHKE